MKLEMTCAGPLLITLAPEPLLHYYKLEENPVLKILPTEVLTASRLVMSKEHAIELLRECRGAQYTICCREVKEERSGIEQESAKGRASLMAQW